MAHTTYDDKRARTRQKLLDAGAELLPGAILDGLAQSLGPVTVARHAGLSRQTWYRYWASAPEYISELLARTLEDIRVGELAQFTQVSTVAGDLGPMTERIRAGARARLSRRMEPEVALPVLLAGALLASGVARTGPLATIEDALARYFAEQDRHGQRVIGALLAGWDRMPTPQLGIERLVAALNALNDGMILRAATDHAYGPHLFADVLVLLLPALSVPDPMATRALGIVDDVSGDDPASDTGQQRAARVRRERTRALILTAARTEFSANGYQQTTIATIAAASHVSETTIFEHFGSKAGIAAAAFAPAIGILVEGIGDDAALGHVDRIRNHLARLSALLHRSPAFVAAYFDVGAYVVAPGRPVDRLDPRLLAPVEAPLVPLMEDAQCAGVVVDALPARQIAGGITILMMTRVFGYPQEDPEATARAVEILALHGALSERSRDQLAI